MRSADSNLDCTETQIFPSFLTELSYFNHSCNPNGHMLQVGGKALVRAAQAIPAGQEVSVSYIGPMVFSSIVTRRNHLASIYKFE